MKLLLNKLNAHAGEFNVSLIVPIENESFDKEINRGRVKEAIREAGEKILDRRTDYDFLIDRLMKLYDAISWDHPMKGVGLFVSPAITEWVYFSNPVTEKIMVGDLFETRDLVFEMTHSMTFWLLVMSMNRTRLFRGDDKKLAEVKDDRFPCHYKEEFQFDKTPSRIRSTEGVEQSRVLDERKREYFRKVDAALGVVIRTEELPLIIAGVNEVTALFHQVTKHNQLIIGSVHGNFDYASDSEITNKVTTEIVRWQENEKEKLIHRFMEAIGAHKCVWGVKDVWEAAMEGRCDTLLVEKDYLMPAMFTNDLFLVNLDGRNQNLSPQTNDVVNNIINMVIAKNGKVVFANNEELTPFDKIASLLRY